MSMSSEELEFRQHCRKFRVTSETVEILCENGISSVAALSTMSAGDLQKIGLDQEFAVETAVTAAKRVSQMLSSSRTSTKDDLESDYDIPDQLASQPENILNLRSFLVSMDGDRDHDSDGVSTDERKDETGTTMHSGVVYRNKNKDDVFSASMSNVDDDDDFLNEYERLDMNTTVEPDPEAQTEEKSPKTAPKPAAKPVARPTAKPPAAPGSPPKPASPPIPARRTTVNKSTSVQLAKQGNVSTDSDESNDVEKNISKEESDEVYDELAKDNLPDYADESCDLPLSQATKSKSSDNDAQTISDDPMCHSIGETEIEIASKNEHEEGILIRMHKNSVYNKDLVIIPSSPAPKTGNEDSGTAPSTRSGSYADTRSGTGSTTGSKTFSSGSEDSYERVDMLLNNSVMIYDDVMGPKGDGIAGTKDHGNRSPPRVSEWSETVTDMDGMLDMYDTAENLGQKHAQLHKKPYEGVHMYHELNEAEMLAQSGEYTEIPTSLIRRSIGSKKLPPMQALHDEMVITEKDYVAKLHMLDKIFFVRVMEENKKKHILPESDVTTMLSTLPIIHVLHETSILPNLQEQLQLCTLGSWPALASVLEPLVSDLEMYTSYASTLDRAVYLITFWKQRNANFAKIVSGTEKQPACGIVPLHLHLFEPLHRLGAYQNFLKRYLHFLRNGTSERELKEKKTAQDVLERIAEVSEAANNAVKQAEERVRREELERRLGPGIVQRTSGELVREGPVRVLHPKTGNIQNYHLFLFSDVLLVTQPYKGPSGDDYKLHAKMPLSELKLAERGYGASEKSIAMTSNEKFLELLPSETGKPNDSLGAWLSVLIKSIEKIPNEESSKTEAIGYRTPMLERFQDHAACMQCAETFKRSRKRHHCKGCGIVICPSCSSHTLRMRFRKNTSRRICDECYVTTCKRRTSSVDMPMFFNSSPTSPRLPNPPKPTDPKPDLLKTHSVTGDDVYVDPSTMDSSTWKGTDPDRSPNASHRKSSSIDSQSSGGSAGHRDKSKDKDDVFDEDTNPKFPNYSIVSKHGHSPHLTFAKEIADKKNEKEDLKQTTQEMSTSQRPVPMKRSISGNTKSIDSPENEANTEDTKPIPKAKPKAGGWMKILRKMSSSHDSADIAPAELSADELEVSPPVAAGKQKQVAAVRIPSAMSGEAWLGVISEFKGQGRSMDDESKDDLESTTF